MVPPWDTKDGEVTSELVENVDAFFFGAVCAPRLAAVKEHIQDVGGVDSDLKQGYYCGVENTTKTCRGPTGFEAM